MASKDNNFGVVLYDRAWDELGEAVKPYEQSGPIGKYIYCKKFDVVGQFIELGFTTDQVSNQISDEMSIWIPASFVKFIATSTEASAKKVGFVQ